MSYLNVGKEKDQDVTIYYKDWGEGDPVVFSHGWPLNADAWEGLMSFLACNGYRCIAPDRRGHGRSSQPWKGHDMDTYASDLAKLLENLNLNKVTLIGHSTGGGVIARYIGLYGTKRIDKAIFIGAVVPQMVKTASNPGGLPLEVFDKMRQEVHKDRSQFFKDLAPSFYGADSSKYHVSGGVLDDFLYQSKLAAYPALYKCIKEFSETNFTKDLEKIDVPSLFIHGDEDKIVPFKDSALLASKIVKSAKLKVYKGAPHGLFATHKDKLNADVLAFIHTGDVKN